MFSGGQFCALQCFSNGLGDLHLKLIKWRWSCMLSLRKWVYIRKRRVAKRMILARGYNLEDLRIFQLSRRKIRNWAFIGNTIFFKTHSFIKNQKTVILLQWPCIHSSTKTGLFIETYTSVVVPGENNTPYSSYLSQFLFGWAQEFSFQGKH